MKNFLILGLVALLLFAVSAALSLWLNQAKEGESEKKETKKSAKETSREKDDELRPTIRPDPSKTAETNPKMAAELREQLAIVKEREARLDRRQAHIELLLQDIRSEREVIDNLRKQVNVEMKLLTDKSTELDNKFAQLDRERELTNKKIDEAQKRVIDISQNEEKNFLKLAEMYNAMPPENAAKILQQLADTGKLETAVKVLSQMKETKAAKVLAEMTDQGLAAQMVEKMRGVKRAAPPMPPGG